MVANGSYRASHVAYQLVSYLKQATQIYWPCKPAGACTLNKQVNIQVPLVPGGVLSCATFQHQVLQDKWTNYGLYRKAKTFGTFIHPWNGCEMVIYTRAVITLPLNVLFDIVRQVLTSGNWILPSFKCFIWFCMAGFKPQGLVFSLDAFMPGLARQLLKFLQTWRGRRR